MVQTGEEPTTVLVEEGSVTMPGLVSNPIVSQDGVWARNDLGPASSEQWMMDVVYPSISCSIGQQITAKPGNQ